MDLSKIKDKTLIVDFDTPIYVNAGFCQTNYTYVHKETGERKPYTSQKEFHDEIDKHNKKADVEGLSLMDINNYEMVREVLPRQPKDGSDPISIGCHGLKLAIKRLKNLEWVSDIKLVFHNEGNFRDDVATILEYKGNRKEKPMFVKEMKEYVRSNYKDIVIEANGEETDDHVARIAWGDFYDCQDKANYSDLNIVIGHVDKDLDQIPGWHYNYDKKELYTISVRQATRSFWGQCLTGDSGDNIPGIPEISKEYKKKYGLRSNGGYGEKTADKLLEDCITPTQMAERVVEAYKDGFGEDWLDKLQEISTLLYLRRQENEIFDVRKSLDRLGVDYDN